jgi:hypothetical protein
MSKLKNIVKLLISENINEAATQFIDNIHSKLILEGFESDRSIAIELYNYLRNDSDIYKRGFLPLAKAVQKRITAGTYNKQKGIKAAFNLTNVAAKKYLKDYGDRTNIWYETFTPEIRQFAAEEVEEYITTEIELGNSWI